VKHLRFLISGLPPALHPRANKKREKGKTATESATKSLIHEGQAP
jgi:hypothetical protein